jgi:hypothetical protein
LDRLVRDGRDAVRDENWRHAIDVFGQVVERITQRIQNTILEQDGRLDLIARRVEHRSDQLAAMAKDPEYPPNRVRTVVDSQMHDLNTHAVTLPLRDEKAKRVVESLAEALCTHDEEDMAVERLTQMVALRHIFRRIARSEIFYQLGKIFSRQNHPNALPRLLDSIRNAGDNTLQRLKCSVKWAEDAARRGTNISDITDVLWRVWENRAGLLEDRTMLQCGLILGKGYVDQGRMDRAAAVLTETHEHLPEGDKRVDAAKHLILAIDNRSYTPELERLCRTVIAALADAGVERARYEFILGRALHATANVAETRTLLQRAHNTMERNRAVFPVDDRYECRVRLGRTMLKAKVEAEQARAHLRAAWDARAQLGARVAVLAGAQHARTLAASGARADREQAGAVYARMWADHGQTALPADLQATAFWSTLVAAAGYYAQHLAAAGTPAALDQLRQVVERGRSVQQQLELPADRRLEQAHSARLAPGGIPLNGPVAMPERIPRARRLGWRYF